MTFLVWGRWVSIFPSHCLLGEKSVILEFISRNRKGEILVIGGKFLWSRLLSMNAWRASIMREARGDIAIYEDQSKHRNEKGEYEWFSEDTFHHYFCMNVWPRSWGKRARRSQFTRIGVHNLTQGGCHTARRLLCQNMHSLQKGAASCSWSLIFPSSAFITEFDF